MHGVLHTVVSLSHVRPPSYYKVRMTVKKLAFWTIFSSTSAAGLGYAMYDIKTNGEVIDWTDSTGDGVVDSAIVDTDGVAGGEYAVQDVDADGSIDRIMEMNDNGTIGEVIGDGETSAGVVESVFDILGSFF